MPAEDDPYAFSKRLGAMLGPVHYEEVPEGAEPEGPSKAVRNERRKLSANWCNTLATGAVVVGVFGPTQAVFGTSSGTLPSWVGVVTSLGWFLAGFAIHIVGRHILGRMEE